MNRLFILHPSPFNLLGEARFSRRLLDVVKSCPNCHLEVADDARFCPDCGTAIAAATSTGASPSPNPVMPPRERVEPEVTAGRPPGAAKKHIPAPAPPAPGSVSPRTAPPRDHSRGWWIVPVVIIGIVVIAFLVLAGMPFGDDESPRADRTITSVARPTATIAEVPPPQQPGTVGMPPSQIGTQPSAPLVPQPGAPPTPLPTGTLQPMLPPGTQPPPTDTTARMPPSAVAPPVPAPAPPPVTTIRPPATTTTAPRTTQPPPAREPVRETPPPPREPRRETPPPREPEPPPREREREPEPRGLTEAQATGALHRYLVTSNYYEIDADCIRIRSRGRAPGGWNLTAWNACAAGGGTRLLGRWYVNASTRDIRRQ